MFTYLYLENSLVTAIIVTYRFISSFVGVIEHVIFIKKADDVIGPFLSSFSNLFLLVMEIRIKLSYNA